MQTLVELIQELKRLATGTADDKLERINQLLGNPRAPAEFQVGRYYVARLLQKDIDAGLASLDPRERKVALQSARLVYPRTVAVRAMRRVSNDPDGRVRALALRSMDHLGIHQPAPPRTYRHPQTGAVIVRPVGQGAQKTTTLAWAFGIFPTQKSKRGKAKPATKLVAGLPGLTSLDDVATLVGVADPDDLTAMMRPGTGPGSGYVEFEIPKAKGGTRRIAAPRAPLRKVQRAILDHILAKVPMHDACHGFVAGRSTVTNAAPHVKAAVVVKLDLQDFFPTVHYRRVRGLFQYLGYSETIASALAGLTTYRPKLPSGEVLWPGVLPQGAPTSPALANLACRRLDARLAKLAAKYGATYTRYADDLTFSFATTPDIRLGRFLWWVDGICHHEGFLERPDKRRILRNKHQQRVTGIVVNAGVHVPRLDRKRFRAILHNCTRHGVASQARGREDFTAYLAGYAAYVHMVEPALGDKLVAEVEALLAREGGHG